MPWNSQGGGPWGSGKGRWGSEPQSSGPTPPDLEELLRRGQDKLRTVLPGGSFGGAVFVQKLAPGPPWAKRIHTVHRRCRIACGKARKARIFTPVRRLIREIPFKARRPGREEAMKPVVVLVGADKGGVGKTTITRTLLDYLAARNTPARAFDSEFPRGALKRFHPKITQIIDLETAADQIKVIDTLSTSDVKVSVIDVRAGLLLDTLKTFAQVGFFDLVGAGEFNFILFHVIGPSIASLEEIAEIRPYADGRDYLLLKNFINETSFFEWNPELHRNYYDLAKDTIEVAIPKLNEMAFEQAELASVPFSAFIANKTADGQTASNSLVLRGYVRSWMNQITSEYDRIGLIDRLSDRGETTRAA